MHTLQLPFKLLTISGIWMPLDWSNWYQKLVWIFFSCITTALVVIQFGEVAAWLLCSKNFTEFSERLLFAPTGISCICKIYACIVHRKQLISLGNMFLNHCCIPRNAQEIVIQEKYDKFIRVITLAFSILVNVTIMNMISLPLVINRGNRTLPVEVWLPYNLDSDMSYWISYIQQVLSIFFSGTSAVSGTLIINGFIYQVCAQFEILSNRFYKLPLIIEQLKFLNKPYHLIYKYEKKVIRENVQHHLHIFRLAEFMNEIFEFVIFQQFCLSTIVVSSSVYQLSTRQEKDMGFIMVFCYLSCTLMEFLVYCWFGNEVMIESIKFQDSIYAIDWTALSSDSKRDLVFVILRTTKPITINSGHFTVLSLESYISILKMSYSVFNVLRLSS